MKVCKKCKAHVANKMKICKYCGADVSKAAIIKNPDSNGKGTKKNVNSAKKTAVQNVSNEVNATLEKTEILETAVISTIKDISSNKKEPKKQTSNVKKTKKGNKKGENASLEKTELLETSVISTIKDISSNKKEPKKQTSNVKKTKKGNKKGENASLEKTEILETSVISTIKDVSSDEKSIEKININKDDIKTKLFKIGSKFLKVMKAIFNGFDKGLDFISAFLASVITYVVKFLNKFIYLLYVVISKALKYFILGLKKLFGFISIIIVSIVHFIKNCFVKLSNHMSYFRHRRKIRSINKKIVFEEAKKAEKTVVEETPVVASPMIIEKTVVKEAPVVIEKTTVKPKKRRKVLKPVLISLFIITIFGVLGYFGFDFYKELKGASASVIVSEKATTDKIFAIGDSISYNGVDYRITNVETSMGNAYKSPKSGNQFLIVYLSIKNKTDNKIPYSYQNWTMSNSKGEEKKRIFTSINVQTALYSGELVIGGVKNGSIVFEQPINDKKLRMNFYELKKDKEGYDVADLTKRVFSVSIKVPDKKIKESPDKKEIKKVSTKVTKKKS